MNGICKDKSTWEDESLKGGRIKKTKGHSEKSPLTLRSQAAGDQSGMCGTAPTPQGRAIKSCSKENCHKRLTQTNKHYFFGFFLSYLLHFHETDPPPPYFHSDFK